MYALLVTIKMKPERREEFIGEMVLDARGSRQNEPGCLRFDVIQDEQDANTIYLYEVYRDKAAFEAHLTQPHFIRWRDAVADWRAAPATVGRGITIDPPDPDWR